MLVFLNLIKMKLIPEERKIIISTFPDREFSTSIALKPGEKFFINIRDKDNKPQFQFVETVEDLICGLNNDYYLE